MLSDTLDAENASLRPGIIFESETTHISAYLLSSEKDVNNIFFGDFPVSEQPLSQVAAEEQDGEATERIRHHGEISDDASSES